MWTERVYYYFKNSETQETLLYVEKKTLCVHQMAFFSFKMSDGSTSFIS
jgi:hypothetical protein